ncbi:hypothetical protein [Ruegeria halocynthiae]|uniref:hypothetical protein n=1 Tax=Ruegeria halocynthiae TaxID=985054 RepID=UPI001268CB58|nr:hypothetical protein [Ruegeria halocynthiae]
MRACLAFGLFFFALTALIFSVPTYFSESVKVEYNNGFTGESGEYTAPGSQLVAMLVAFPVVFGLFGAFFGWQARKQRQLTLLAASNPVAPIYLKKKIKTRFLDRTLYRLNLDGTDMQVAGIKND